MTLALERPMTFTMGHQYAGPPQPGPWLVTSDRSGTPCCVHPLGMVVYPTDYHSVEKLCHALNVAYA